MGPLSNKMIDKSEVLKETKEQLVILAFTAYLMIKNNVHREENTRARKMQQILGFLSIFHVELAPCLFLFSWTGVIMCKALCVPVFHLPLFLTYFIIKMIANIWQTDKCKPILVLFTTPQTRNGNHKRNLIPKPTQCLLVAKEKCKVSRIFVDGHQAYSSCQKHSCWVSFLSDQCYRCLPASVLLNKVQWRAARAEHLASNSKCKNKFPNKLHFQHCLMPCD